MSEENVEKMRAAFDAFNRGDLDGLLADLAPEFEYIPTGGLPDSDEVYRGLDEYRRFFGWFTDQFDDPRIEANEVIDAGDAVRDDGTMVNQLVASLTNHGRGKISGVETTWTVWIVWTIEDGRGVKGQAFTRKEEAFDAAGLSE